MLLEDVVKPPSSTYTKEIDHTAELPVGATPSAVATTAVDILDNSDATATVLGGTSVSGNYSLFVLTGGIDGRSYLVTITTTLSNGNTLQHQLMYHCRTTSRV